MKEHWHGILKIAAVVVLVGSCVLVALSAYNHRQAQRRAASVTALTNVPDAPEVNVASDLEAADTAIDGLDFDATLQELDRLDRELQAQ